MRTLLLSATSLGFLAFTPAQEETSERAELRTLIESHCATCHSGPRPKARLDLEGFEPSSASPEQLSSLLERVRNGEMPPPERLGDFGEAQRSRFVSGAEAMLQALAPDPGRPTLRRLNRYEYGNAVRSLLAIDLALEDDLPEDGSSEGFDNQGDVLFVTPHVAELFLDATERAIEAFEASEGPRQGGLVDANGSVSSVEEDALTAFLTRAFRRPPGAEELEARKRLLQGEGGLRAMLTSVLLSPHFLYRIEEDRNQTDPWRISAWELATRLSFFLWAAPPDDELIEVALSGRLLEEAMLHEQVERMLNDGRSRALATRFAGRWLGFADLPKQGVDTRRFRGTSTSLKESMARESTLFFDALVREDRSLLELVDSPSTFLDARLALHYGIEGVQGKAMRRVELGDRRRGGVLTQASVLTMTSQPLRTSPVVRGAWILDRLLGAPSPPPPPNAGTLPADDQADEGLSLRQQLERHRADPSCASCHARIDPLGFALENYDGVGRWRDEDHVGPVDARAVLPDGREIEGIVGLKDALLEDPAKIARGTSEALLVYALGRPLEPCDDRVVTKLVDALEASDWSTRTLIHEIVASYPFQHRRRAR